MSLPLPPFPVIDAALRKTTARLVREVAEPQPATPGWNEFEWAVARAVCAMHGLAALLARRLAWQGPAHWQTFLDTQHAHMVARDAHVGSMLAQLDSAFTAAGICLVPLKGSALRTLQLYETGERPQSDIDLLVAPEQAAACDAPLAELGYHFVHETRRHRVYAPSHQFSVRNFGEHVDHPLTIELHTRVVEALPVEPVDITSTLHPRSPRVGINPYASRAALLRHLCLHTAGGMRAHAMRFIQIVDISRLAPSLAAADWRELMSADESGNRPWWLFPPLIMAARHVPGSVPDEVLAELRRLCTQRLVEHYEHVSICEASWSNLRIAALPGNEWSRNAGDTLRLVRSRLLPSRAALDDLAVTLTAQPQYAQIRWYGASHPERIARWLFTRTPRVQTLSAVSAAWRDRPAP